MPNTTLILLIAAIIVALANLVFLILNHRRSRSANTPNLAIHIENFEKGQDKLEKAFREEMAKARQESAEGARCNREEVSKTLKELGDSNMKAVAGIGEAQDKQLRNLAERIAELTKSNEGRLNQMRETVERKMQSLQEENSKKLEEMPIAKIHLIPGGQIIDIEEVPYGRLQPCQCRPQLFGDGLLHGQGGQIDVGDQGFSGKRIQQQCSGFHLLGRH